MRSISDLERNRTRKPYPSSIRSLARALGLPEVAAHHLVAQYRTGHSTGAVAAPDSGWDEPQRLATGRRPPVPVPPRP